MGNFQRFALRLFLPFALSVFSFSFNQLVLVECRSMSGNRTSTSTDSDSKLTSLNSALDELIVGLYGDIEPQDQLLWNTADMKMKHPDHVGDDNAIHYSNEWLVHVENGKEAADRLAAQSGYENLGELKEFPNVYLMRKQDHPTAHKRSSRELTKQLQAYPEVGWAEQQFSKSRVKRDAAALINLVQNFRADNFFRDSNLANGVFGGLGPSQRFNDPLWDKQWYMQDTRTRKSLPRLDLNVIPVFNMGFSGKGVNVVILDDGIEHTHEDLAPNYVPSISGDLNDNDNDPSPHYGSVPENSHGTRCAGEVAMVANNSNCGVGIAYNAGIGGVRMLDGPVSDRIEGEALSFALPEVDVYSASWGPSDDGQTVEGPGRLAQKALLKGITEGRNGKGTVYVWASGNGGSKGDCCSCDGYASSIFTLSIGSASESGTFPWYGEKCPSTMAVAYSSGAYTDQKIATTDLMNQCTTSHTGTSAAAPLAAGIVALALEANGKLTWRDVQHLTVWTSQPGPLKENPGWHFNSAGFEYNSRFGFGLLDAEGMVKMARNWITAPQQKICRVKALPLSVKVIDPMRPKVVEFISDACQGTANEINFLEHVQVVTTVQFSQRGALQIDLTSPQGTITRLLFPRKYDSSATGFSEWPFTSVHTWGENPQGKWILNLTDSTRNQRNQGYMQEAELILYGTTKPTAEAAKGRRVYPQEYKKKSLLPQNNDAPLQPSDRLKAILDDMNNWI